MSKKYNVIGIGNAIVDTVCLVEDKFLTEHNLVKGGMFLIDEENAVKLSRLKHKTISSGGSVANTIATLAMLDCRTALIGKVGKDKFGDIFFDDLEKINCEFVCKHKEKSGTTAKSFVLITPDGERTMCTYLGLASKIANEIDEDLIKDAEVLYLEGYLWDEPETIAALRQAIEIAKDNDIKVAFSLSDAFCVERHRAEFLDIADHLDILFANEVEMSVLIGQDFAANDYQKVKETISHHNPHLVVAMTMGEKGAMIFRGEKSHLIPTAKVEKLVDATGAGDSFAAGFLYGIDNGLSLQESAAFGNVLAGGVIIQIGARLNQEKLLELIKS